MLPEHLTDATSFTTSALRAVTDRDWSFRAGDLEWDIAFTVTHIAGCMTKYATYLAAAATRWSPLAVSHDERATNEQLVDAVDISAAALAFIADSVAPDRRGFHGWGMVDASASLARAAIEVLVHGWDVASGLSVAFEPPPDLCSPVIARTFPWAASTSDPWETLLTANGRRGEPAWTPIEAPLDEWDGSRPTGGRPPAIAWDLDPATGQWVPTYP